MGAITQYARSGDLEIAYQVHGDGPFDVVFVPLFISHVEIMWEHPRFAAFLDQVASFSRLVMFDRRGTGMSDGMPGAASLEDQVEDVRAVLDAVGSEAPVLLSMLEGCALSALYAASHPEAARALVMMTPLARVLYAPDYDWAPTREQRTGLVEVNVANWGIDTDDNAWVRTAGDAGDERGRRAIARLQRYSMTPRAAERAHAAVGEVDIRDLLPSIQCPTLIVTREHDPLIDARHGHYAAEHIPGAKHVVLPGAGTVMAGHADAADEIQQFLTGVRRPAVSDRVLATVLFTDIVGSTERAAALGDGPWRDLLARHDALVRADVERHRGRYVKSLGDGALAIFDGPSRAISAATAIRDGLRGLDIDVRCGLHTGECELLGDDDIGGLAVHIGARVSSIAAPGEVLVSSTVRDLVVGSGQVLAERGEHELKGVPGPWRLYAVDAHERRGPA